MHGSLAGPYLGNMTCFRTDKYGNIVGLKSPDGPRVPSGKQGLYRHQIYYWSLHWNFMWVSDKAKYNELGEAADMTGYDYFMKTHYSRDPLFMHPMDNNGTYERWPDWNIPGSPYIDIADRIDRQRYVYLTFPLDLISQNLTITKAELWVYYEGWWDNWPGGKQVDCHKIIEPWTERSLTWNNSPAVHSEVTDTTVIGNVEKWHTFDITDDINLIISGAPSYGWRINFHLPVTTNWSWVEWRSTYHDYWDSRWPYLKLELS